MKNLLFILLILCPILSSAQATANEISGKQKASVMITPLGDLINDHKSSIYFKWNISKDPEKKKYFRVGTEMFNSISTEIRPGVEIKSNAYNLKMGLEFHKELSAKISTYFGPEISYDRYKTPESAFLLGNNSIFSNNAIGLETFGNIEESTLSIFSLIGFIGFKYKLIENLNVGIESAIGVGFFKTTTSYSSFFDDESLDGEILDIAANRFIILEYNF